MMCEEVNIAEQTPDNDTTVSAEQKKAKWASFIESDVANFFTGYKLEKMTLEDGSGNKAKIGRTKDGGIKIEYTSTVLI